MRCCETATSQLLSLQQVPPVVTPRSEQIRWEQFSPSRRATLSSRGVSFQALFIHIALLLASSSGSTCLLARSEALFLARFKTSIDMCNCYDTQPRPQPPPPRSCTAPQFKVSSVTDAEAERRLSRRREYPDDALDHPKRVAEIPVNRGLDGKTTWNSSTQARYKHQYDSSCCIHSEARVHAETFWEARCAL